MAADKDRLTDLIEQAAVAAAAAPESLREAAFNQAFAYLAGTGAARETPTRPRDDAKPIGRQRARRQAGAPDTGEGIDAALAGLDRTKYAKQIKSSSRALDKALWVLHAAHDDLGIDGLTVGAICGVLRDKFRVVTKEPAIRMALDRAGAEVDVVRHAGQPSVYRIMAAGEETLFREATDEAASRAKPKRAKAVQKSSTAPSQRAAKRAKNQEASGKRVAGRARVGTSASSPTGLLRELVQRGYFDTPRTVGEIADHLKVKKGSRINTVSLSVALMRSVRNEELTRDRRQDGTYEYTRRK